MLKIRLLGKSEITWKGQPLDGQLSGKNIPLLYLLLQSDAHFLTREKLACYLWPDSTPDAARYNLRYNLWQLKKALPLCDGETLVVTEKDGVQLNANYPWQCDLTEIRYFQVNECTSEELLRLSNLFQGEVMDGWYLKNCNEFNDLILLDRMMCQRRQVELLRTLAMRYQQSGNYQTCLETLEKITLVEPDNEEVALSIMETYLHLGDRVGAIRYYKQFEETLWNDLNISPNAQLHSLYSKLKNGEMSVSSPAPPSSAAAETIIPGYCLASVHGFLLSDLLENLLSSLEPKLLFSLPIPFLQDLRCIHSGLVVAYEEFTGDTLPLLSQPAPDVRIIHAFRALIVHICAHQSLRMQIHHREQADTLSSAALSYLQDTMQGKNLILENV